MQRSAFSRQDWRRLARSGWCIPLCVAIASIFVAACGDATGPEGAYIRAEITGAIQDTFSGGADLDSWYHIRRGFHMYQIHGTDRRTSSRNVISRRGLTLWGLQRTALPAAGAIPLEARDAEDPDASGWVATYVHEGDRFVSQRGFIRPTEFEDGMVAGAFTFHAFRYCPADAPDPCAVPERPPEDAMWIEVNGRFRGEAPPDPRR